ncbi:MAG: molybdopterin-dependent oxidoreductase [Gemmatimonadaceae bacterium]|nr:molybdopterin-dependent oxidoreductase [Gloeobacterales cyanobacterium ES-bin-141]
MSLIRVPRRRFVQLSGLSLLLGGCGSSLFESVVGRATEPLNQSVEQLIFNPQKLAPEFPASAIEPDALLINTAERTTPQIDQATFRLVVDGEVDNPLSLSLAEILEMPMTSMVIRHVCVEGWAAIVQWGGVRLRDLARLAGPKPGVRYAYFESAGNTYYESWDIASSLHPQTLLAYQKNNAPLPVENGAPLRLASPLKLGYKQSKWITRVTLLSELPVRKGFWEDQGYEWYGGL